MIQLPCGECGQELQVPEDAAGKKVRCPKCQAITAVPVGGPPPTAITAEEAPARERGPARIQADAPTQDRGDEPDDRPGRGRRRPPRDEEDDADDGPRGAGGPKKTSGKAIASLILGLLSVVCLLNVLTGLPALILGLMAMGDVSRSRGRVGGTGLAITGLILGILGMVLMLPAVLLALLLPAVSKVREASARMSHSNNMKQIALAMHNHESTFGGFPAAAITDNTGKPLLSWRVAILPFIEQDNLFKQFKLDEPWDGPTNRPLLSRIPKTYLVPGKPDDGSGKTHYQVFVGPRTMFERPEGGPFIAGLRPGRRVADIPDGLSNTIMVAEAANPVEWTKPDDLKFDPNGPLPPLGGNFRGVIHIALGDGSVRAIPASTPEATIKAAITRNGAEPVFLP